MLPIERLAEEFPGENVVVRPDHPLLLRGPDLLVASGGNLVAVFSPQALEENNPAHLATRLIAARLALPPRSRTILILGRDHAPKFEPLGKDFGLTTDPNDPSLASFVRDQTDFGSSFPIDPKIQRLVVRQFDLTFAATEVAFRASRRVRRRRTAQRSMSYRSRAPIRIESDGLQYEPQNRVWLAEGMVSVLNAVSRPGLRRQLITTSSGHLLESFTLDQGVPIPRNLKPHVAIAEHADQVFGLRSKAIMAAAFSGISIAPDDDPDVTHQLFFRLGSEPHEGQQ